jgi:hypothetical protein
LVFGFLAAPKKTSKKISDLDEIFSFLSQAVIVEEALSQKSRRRLCSRLCGPSYFAATLRKFSKLQSA